MSYTETHFGKLRKADLGNLTVEEWCEQKCREKGDTELESWNSDWTEQFRDSFHNKYFIVENTVYEVFDHVEAEEGNDVDIMIPNPDGTFTFVMQFYNGGTCLPEMIEDGLKRINKNK